MGQGYVLKRGKRYRGQFYLGQGRYLSKQFPSRREAESWLAKDS